jgi:hypothetical protein
MRKLLSAAALSAAVVLSTFVFPGEARVVGHSGEDGELPERDEINQSFELSPGARVEVADISGWVRIETSDTNKAEVNVVRSARTREDLRHRVITVEHTPSSLVVRTQGNNWNLGREAEVRQHVTLRLPRNIELTATDISGSVRSTEIDGPVRLTDISGKVEIASAAGRATIADISGRVALNLSGLVEPGLQVSDISGAVDIGLSPGIGAELTVTDVSGNVSLDVPNATMQGKMDSSDFRARIGAGGPPITVSDVSGRIRFFSAGGSPE